MDWQANMRTALVGVAAFGAVILYNASSVSDSSAPASKAQSLVSKGLIQVDRFSWEASGSGSCEASARLRNGGTSRIASPRLILQFVRNGQLVGSVGRYAPDIEVGGTSTWQAYYDCPGKGSSVEFSAEQNYKDTIDVEVTAGRSRG